MKAKTVIGKANELVAEHGKEYAIKYFQDKIDEMGNPKDTVELFRHCGWVTAIKHINENHINRKP